MKRLIRRVKYVCNISAAFGRLRVETEDSEAYLDRINSAAFGRLRVETSKWQPI